MRSVISAASLALLASTAPALADITACVTVSATGPAASLGVPERNTVPFLPTTVGGETIRYVVFDDATDPTTATLNVRKCLSEEKGDIIIGSSATPPSVAAASVAAETKTPVISLSPVGVPSDVEKWTFRAPQNISQMAGALITHMKANGVKSLAFIGYSDAYGEQWLNAMQQLLAGSDITLGPIERYARADTSVTGQVLKLLAGRPDSVLVVSSGTPGALPNLALGERGFKGQIYHTHGSASRDFIRVAGKAAEGTILPVGPVVVAEQLPPDHDSRALALDYARKYEAAHGKGTLSSFGGHMFDAGQLLAAAVPKALAKAKPGTPEFRAALRDALETAKNVVGVHGVFNMGPNDHFGHDERSRVLVQIKDGDWKYLPGK